jgi:uncharacterized Zn-binding protein involved in type VI secretion
MSFLLHVGATAICPHAGQISVITSNTRVTVNGQPVATLADTFLIAGCSFVVSGVPQPCLKVQWLVPATRVTVNGQPAILQTSSGICQGAAPQGPPNVIATQVRVSGT